MRPVIVRVHSPVGVAEVLWHGEPHDAGGWHHVEWTVDEEIVWGRNTVSATVAEPGLRQDGSKVVMRGRLRFTVDGAVVIELGESRILLDLASPASDGVDGAWIEISAEAETIGFWPCRL